MTAAITTMTIKARLHRLLLKSRSGKSRLFRNKNDDTVDNQSLTDNTHTSTTTTNSSLASSNSQEFFDHYITTIDPYEDVRERLDALSSNTDKGKAKHKNDTVVHTERDLSAIFAYFVYLSYFVVIIVGRVRDVCAIIFRRGRWYRRNDVTGYPSDNIQNFAPLLKSWENFYSRRIYSRVQDVFNRPVASNPGSVITIIERISDNERKSMKILGSLQNLDNNKQRNEYKQNNNFCFSHDGKVSRTCINLGSYNYLGFADNWDVTCSKDVKSSLCNHLPVSMSSSRTEYGTTNLHTELEETVASFLHKEDALVLNMGFNTNATTIPALVGPGDLLLSDELNHTSIVNGARASGASIRIFHHNDMNHLETILRESIINGRPRVRRPWNKILVVVEGIYSMEGEYCNLPGIVQLCKKYGAYIYLDEAHSIGAMGHTGRGITEYLGVNTNDIDIMMGTFTKSFGGMGGYVAASKDIISYLRQHCNGSVHHNALSPIVCQQILTTFKIIKGEDGTNIGRERLQSLKDNSNYFRMRLCDMGLHVLGKYDSPIIPVMLYHLGMVGGFSRECYKRGLAVVVVGFPAVPLLLARARFCISASHTREQLDQALTSIEEITTILKLRYYDK